MATNRHVIAAARLPAPAVTDSATVSPVQVRAGTGSATSAIDLYAKPSGQPVWYKFHADGQPVYLTFGDASVAAPSSSAVVGSASQAIKLEAGTKDQWQFDGVVRYFRALQAVGGFLRVEKVGLEDA